MSDSDEISYCNCHKKDGGMLEFIFKKSGMFHVDCGKEIQMPIVTAKADYWCDHIHRSRESRGEWVIQMRKVPTSMDAEPKWSFCPICGTSRPKELNAADELDRILNSYQLGDVKHPESKRLLFSAILEKFMLREK